MIKYTLKCAEGHDFESWFDGAEAYEKLETAGLLSCAVCGNSEVSRALSAPQVSTARSKEGPLSKPMSTAEQAMAELRKHVEENTDDVGKDFAKEARKIADGDAPERAIRGEAKLEEAKALVEDGIPVAPLPWARKQQN